MSYMSLHTVGMRMRPETRWPSTHPPTDYLRCDALTANFVRHHCDLSASLTVLGEAKQEAAGRFKPTCVGKL